MTISICGLTADIVTGADSLTKTQALFTIEFDYDFKLIVCHALGQTVQSALEAFIRKNRGVQCEYPELHKALINSNRITVNVVSSNLIYSSAVFMHKYDLIRENKCYAPYGYNLLVGAHSAEERKCARILAESLIREIDKQNPKALAKMANYNFRRGRAPKCVYCYNTEGICTGEYVSVQDAARQTGLSASGISKCCNGLRKMLGGVTWSFGKNDGSDNSNNDGTEL